MAAVGYSFFAEREQQQTNTKKNKTVLKILRSIRFANQGMGSVRLGPDCQWRVSLQTTAALSDLFLSPPTPHTMGNTRVNFELQGHSMVSTTLDYCIVVLYSAIQMVFFRSVSRP